MSDCSGGFEGLLERVWCPVCGAKLSIEEVDGRRVLKCSKHGEMKCFLAQDPQRDAIRDVCRAAGVEEEAP